METFDLASDLEQQQRDMAIAIARSSNTKSLLYTGHCYYCDETVPSPRAFCDAACRDDWEWERDRRRVNNT